MNKQELSRMVAEGHEIGNHSDTHPSSLPELSAEELASQIKNVNEAISRLTNGLNIFVDSLATARKQ